MVVNHKLLLAVASASILTLTTVVPVAAAYVESTPKPLRRDTVLRVQDIASKAISKGPIVAIGWREDPRPGRLRVTFSTNGGQDYLRPNGKFRSFPILGDGRLGMSVDVCAGRVWVGSAFRLPGDKAGDSDVVLTTRTIGGGAAQRFITKSSKDRRVRDVQVACLNNDLIATAWLEQRGGRTVARLLLRSTDSLNDDTPSFQRLITLDSEARFKNGIALAATSEAVHVAWVKGSKKHLRLVRVPVDGGTPDVQARTVRTIAWRDTARPQLAAHRDDVVLAYTDGGKLKAKLSNDLGQSWGTATQLLGPGKLKNPSSAYSADIHGDRIVIEAGSNRAGTITPKRLESTDLGAAWSNRSFGHKGTRVGTLLKQSGVPPLLREAWHNNASRDTLRAQYETE
jgi:hypothetical protein